MAAAFFRKPIDKLAEELAELKKEIETKPKKVKGISTTLPKQLLMLHYMGVLKEYTLSNRKNGILLGTLLNADPDNLRKELPDFVGNRLQVISNEKYLNELIVLFNEVGLPKISKAIENDLVRLKKAK